MIKFHSIVQQICFDPASVSLKFKIHAPFVTELVNIDVNDKCCFPINTIAQRSRVFVVTVIVVRLTLLVCISTAVD